MDINFRIDADINYIIQNSINGDKKYQEILIKKLHPLIYKNIYKYYSFDDDIVEDLVQEGYIIILQSLKSYDINRNVHFLRYVKTKLDYYYKNYYRNTKKLRNTFSLNQHFKDLDSGIEIGSLIKDKNTDLYDKIDKEEETHELLTNIKKLTTKEQNVLNMYYRDGLNMTEISERLNIAYRTAIGRKYNAIKKLRSMMGIVRGGENNG